MTLAELAARIGARVYTPGGAVDVDVRRVWAGDRISDLLNEAVDNVLLVSNLASTHLVRVAELMDVPGICLVAGREPDADMLSAARAHGTLLLSSPHGLFETCGRVYQCLAAEAPAIR